MVPYLQSAGESSNTEAYTSLTSQGLKGVEALTLDYRVGWPLSIVLSRRAITKYQLLSRLLYFSKHVERRVLSCWMDHQRTKQLNVRHGLGPSYCLRHRMLQFLQNFVYYMTLEVIGPRGHEMQTELESATDMDQVLEIHEKFLDACLKECLLASQDLLKILTKIMTTCLLFADQMNKFNVEIDTKDLVISTITNKTRTLSVKTKSSTRFDVTNNSNYIDDGKMKLIRERREQINSARSSFIEKETSHESFIRMFVKFSDTFDEQVSYYNCLQ